MYLNTLELRALQTDKERLAALPSVSCIDWDIVSLWAEQTTDSKIREIFQRKAIDLSIREEYLCEMQ